MHFPIRHLMLAAAVSAMLCLSSSASATEDPPSDERVREVVEAFRKQRAEVFKGGPAKAEDLNQLYSDPLKGLDLAQLTPVQIAMMEDAGMLMGTPTAPNSSLRKPAAARAEEFADDPGVEGAVASVMVLQLVGDSVQTPDAVRRRTILERALNHPKLEEAAREHGLPIFQAIRFAGDAKLWKEHRDRIVALAALFDGEPDPRLAMQANDYFELLGAVLDSTDPQQASQRQQIRAKLVEHGRAALDSSGDALSKSEREFLEGAIGRLDGAAARGELIGNAAPGLRFIWCSDENIKSLEDLKGRVVVLDFWATWCGPCIGSIPNVRELQERYKDFPVTIVGVTSIQGSHIPKQGSPIATEGDPQKEFDLMRGYMEEQGITWTIAFSEKDVFNPDFGVRGIPFVAIIDPEGKVRHAGLHPGFDRPGTPTKIERIDALLKEAGLPVPPPAPAAAKSSSAKQ